MRVTNAIGTWRLRLALLASACAAASMSAGGSAAANHSVDVNFSTDFRNFAPGPPPADAYVFGHVDPGPTPCLRDRSFQLYKGPPRTLVDTGRSSNNGLFAVGGDLSGASSVLIRMAKKRFGPRKNRHTCESDTNTIFFAARRGGST